MLENMLNGDCKTCVRRHILWKIIYMLYCIQYIHYSHNITPSYHHHNSSYASRNALLHIDTRVVKQDTILLILPVLLQTQLWSHCYIVVWDFTYWKRCTSDCQEKQHEVILRVKLSLFLLQYHTFLKEIITKGGLFHVHSSIYFSVIYIYSLLLLWILKNWKN